MLVSCARAFTLSFARSEVSGGDEMCIRDRVGCTGLDGFEVGLAQVGLCHAAVALEGTHSGHQHAGRGSDTGVAALDIQKLLCAQKMCIRDR